MRPSRALVVAMCSAFVLAGVPASTAEAATASSRSTSSGSTGGMDCGPGVRTLAPPGSHLYPETGNGGYTSVHTLVHLVYDADANRLLPGTAVVLTDRATQCLTSFSLDFERRSANHSAGPDLTVQSVTVDGVPARFRFVQPTYPGDPAGADDPDPAAHEASQTNPVGGPAHNPLPPACSPELGVSAATAGKHSLDGTQCPADKLVITPSHAIREGATFTVTVRYTGRPGVHNDGDGSTEGWFRAKDGGFVTTEPVGTEDWMPLNDHPSAKPTYDVVDTVTAGRTVIANGTLVASRRNAPDALFPHGSTTWWWRSGAPVASYLVENSVGRYRLSSHVGADGIRYYQGQAAAIPPAQQRRNRAVMDQQEDITDFEAGFTGPFPFATDGVVVGTPQASFEEEMQTMITFAGGVVDTDTLYHENMHQWWGDNVSEADYRYTFFKEGLATVAELLYAARQAQDAAGGPSTARGRAAFQRSLVSQFDQIYRQGGSFWTAAPSDPSPWGLFSGSATYDRPAAAYVALRQILGPQRFTAALVDLQRTYGGGAITERQLEAEFHAQLPVRTPACQARLSQFFTQWFDTAYAVGGGSRRPQITGPGLAGPGFYGPTGRCS